MARSTWTATGAALVLLSSACATSATPPGSQSSVSRQPHSAASIRQTDDAGLPLPFTTVFPNRWSANNDGTSYEPCTAADEALLAAHNVDPTKVEDIAGADGQTARGCRWILTHPAHGRLMQHVGNFTGSLDDYKTLHTETDWRQSLTVNGRTVEVSTDDSSQCTTYLASGTSLVFTTVAVTNPPSLTEICQLAIDFTRATIDKMPP